MMKHRKSGMGMAITKRLETKVSVVKSLNFHPVGNCSLTYLARNRRKGNKAVGGEFFFLLAWFENKQNDSR